MQAGRLDRRIQVERAAVTRSASGAEIRAWPPVGGVVMGRPWAELLDARTIERLVGTQMAAEVEIAWRIRWSQQWADGLTADENVRVIYEGRAYDVLGVHVPPGSRRSELVVRARARAE